MNRKPDLCAPGSSSLVTSQGVWTHKWEETVDYRKLEPTFNIEESRVNGVDILPRFSR